MLRRRCSIRSAGRSRIAGNVANLRAVFGGSGRLRPVSALLQVLVGLSLFAGTDALYGADELSGRDVVVSRIDGPPIRGTLAALREKTLQLTQPDSARFNWNDLISLHWKERSVTRKRADGAVILANGDVLHVNPEVLDDEYLIGRWSRFSNLPAVKIPLETVRGALLAGGGAAADRVQSLNSIANYRDRRDLLWLANGDRLSGQIVSLNVRGLTISTAVGRSTLDRSGIRGLAFSAELVSLPALKAPGVLVTLVDGSRFHAVSLQLGATDRLIVKAQFGADIEFPLTAVESIRFMGGRVTYLSDLEPDEFTFQPFLSITWPWQKDRNVSGGPLRLRDANFAKGLGVHSQCELTYRLDGKYSRFQAIAGIDDATSGRGSVVFRVLLDGASVFESREVTGTDRPNPVGPLDVSRARKLTLRVEFSSQGDIQDHADWCDALLIR